MIYLDYNATTPVDPEVLDEMLPFLRMEGFGNPSSSHPVGQRAKEALERARERVSLFLRCSPGEVVFTSGGSEANNLAIIGTATLRERPGHIITSQVEHPSVLEPCRFLERKGWRVSYIRVDPYGRVDPNDVEKEIGPDTSLITIMHANNEVGTIQPIGEIGEIAQARGVLFHTDAAQSVGKIPTTVEDLKVDLLTVAGHKLYAPKGIGVLYIRKDVRIRPIILGAGQEGGRRAGTESVALAVGLGKAMEVATRRLEADMKELSYLRDLLYQGLLEEVPELKLNGHPEERLPNTLNVSFPGIMAWEMLTSLEGLCASTGAACHTGRDDVSPVLRAMGIDLARGQGAVRFSLGRGNTKQDIEEAVEIIAQWINNRRKKGIFSKLKGLLRFGS